MTALEGRAQVHLLTTAKLSHGRSDTTAQAEVRAPSGASRKLLSDDPEVLRIAADGLATFRLRVAERILAEHPSEVFFNRSPRCGGLARTPRAQLCTHCHYSWHDRRSG
jgi:hypothetical protein